MIIMVIMMLNVFLSYFVFQLVKFCYGGGR